MILQLNEDCRITTDPYNFILERRRVTKEGENKGAETWIRESFHPSLEQAVLKAHKLDLMLSDAEGIESIVKVVKASELAITRAIEELGKSKSRPTSA